jgi:membrane protease YdiL (CAAX protease family)
MGLVTLLLFPIPAFVTLHFMEGTTFHNFLFSTPFEWDVFLIGILVGCVYAIAANKLMQLPVFDNTPLKIDELVNSLNLTIIDALFLSLCAGIGEELLFRVGFQHYFGVILTSVFFVVIHGYLNPFNWRHSLYGIIVLPLSFLLGLGYELLGLWFAIAVHTSYDFTLFIAFSRNKQNDIKEV